MKLKENYHSGHRVRKIFIA